WLVRGCIDWQKKGLNEPGKIIDAIRSYRSEQDVVGDFLSQCCESFLDHPALRHQSRVKAADLYNRYVDWCKENGEKSVLTNRRFGSEMTRRAYPLKCSHGVQHRVGLRLRGSGQTTSDESDSEKPAY